MLDGRPRRSSERTRLPKTRNFRWPTWTSPGHSVLPSSSQRVSKPGTAAESLVSNRWSRPSVSWRNRSLDQITSSVSGWKMTMGSGELSMVSRVAISMLADTLSR